MGVQSHLSLCEPLAQRFGINVEQTTTFNKRKVDHTAASLSQNPREIEGNSRESPWNRNSSREKMIV
jgi:hypothetical protein